MKYTDSTSIHNGIRFKAKVFDNLLFVDLSEKDKNIDEFAPIIGVARGAYFPRFHFGEYKGAVTKNVKIGISKTGFGDKHEQQTNDAFAKLEANIARIVSAFGEFCEANKYTQQFNVNGTLTDVPFPLQSCLSTRESKGKQYTSINVKPVVDHDDELSQEQKITSQFVIDGKDMRNKSRETIWNAVKGGTFMASAKGVFQIIGVNDKFYLTLKNCVIVLQSYSRPKAFDEKVAVSEFIDEFASLTTEEPSTEQQTMADVEQLSIPDSKYDVGL